MMVSDTLLIYNVEIKVKYNTLDIIMILNYTSVKYNTV